jgi:hypothetical protein
MKTPLALVCLILVCLCGGELFSQDTDPAGASGAAGGGLDFDQIRADEEFRWGVRAFHNGFYNEAILSFQKSLSFKPLAALTRSWLGRAYYLAGFTDAALSEWKTVSSSGQGTALLENFIEILESRRGLGAELRDADRWVLSGEIQGAAGSEIVFRRPVAVRAQGDGSFFLVSYMTNEVIHFDSNGLIRRRLRGGLFGFDHPFDLAVAGDGSLYVSEFRGDRVTKCDPSGNVLAVFGGKGREPGKLLGPQYLALDPETAQTAIDKLKQQYQSLLERGVTPVVLCPPVIRIYFKRLTERFIPQLTVLSYNEIDSDFEVEVVGMVSI